MESVGRPVNSVRVRPRGYGVDSPAREGPGVLDGQHIHRGFRYRVGDARPDRVGLGVQGEDRLQVLYVRVSHGALATRVPGIVDQDVEGPAEDPAGGGLNGGFIGDVGQDRVRTDRLGYSATAVQVPCPKVDDVAGQDESVSELEPDPAGGSGDESWS